MLLLALLNKVLNHFKGSSKGFWILKSMQNRALLTLLLLFYVWRSLNGVTRDIRPLSKKDYSWYIRGWCFLLHNPYFFKLMSSVFTDCASRFLPLWSSSDYYCHFSGWNLKSLVIIFFDLLQATYHCKCNNFPLGINHIFKAFEIGHKPRNSFVPYTVPHL